MLQSFAFRWAGAATLLVSSFFLLANGSFWFRGEASTGEVVGLRTVEYASGSRSPTVRSRQEPLISFETVDGEVVNFQASQRFTLSEKLYAEGDSVPVLYAHGKPLQARVRSAATFFLVPLFFMALGGASVYVGQWMR